MSSIPIQGIRTWGMGSPRIALRRTDIGMMRRRCLFSLMGSRTSKTTTSSSSSSNRNRNIINNSSISDERDSYSYSYKCLHWRKYMHSTVADVTDELVLQLRKAGKEPVSNMIMLSWALWMLGWFSIVFQQGKRSRTVISLLPRFLAFTSDMNR